MNVCLQAEIFLILKFYQRRLQWNVEKIFGGKTTKVVKILIKIQFLG